MHNSTLKITTTVILYLLLLLTFGCASDSKRSNASDHESALERARNHSGPDAREFESLDGEYRKRAYDVVLQRSNAFIKTYPDSIFLDQVYNLRALSFIAKGKYQSAAAQLKMTLEKTSSDDLRNMATYNLAYVQHELGQFDQANKTLDALKLSSLEPSDRSKAYILKAKIARQNQNFQTATIDAYNAIRYMGAPRPQSSLEPLLKFLDEVLEPIQSTSDLEKILVEFEDSTAADKLHFKLANIFLKNGEREKAKAHFEKISSNFSSGPYFESAQSFLQKSQRQNVVNPRKIGVVLTLSGKFGRFGQKALQGIKLALKDYQTSTDPGSVVSIVEADDQGEPEKALAAMENLLFNENVSIIIGPLVSKLAEPMGRKAQELGVPLIALSQLEAPGGDFVFNAALTPAIQVRQLIQYATTKVGATSFAILSPSSKFGDEYVKAFWDDVDRKSCSIHGYESYPADETDFRTFIDKLVGLAQTDARAREVEEMRLLKLQDPVKSKSKKKDHRFDLKPIVDFQAVFIPDEPKALGQILPTFAYRDVDHMLFLGNNTWNNPELVARAGKDAEGAVFVDGFFAASENPGTKRFIESFRKNYNSEPSVVEALAYDAAHIAVSVLRNDNTKSRDEVRDRIMGLKDLQGIAGKISYQSGRLIKQLHLLTVKNGRIEEIAFQ